MVQCYVYKCTGSSAQKKPGCASVRLFNFPKKLSRVKLWLARASRFDGKFKIENARVCDRHFSDSQFSESVKYNLGLIDKFLKEDALPQ